MAKLEAIKPGEILQEEFLKGFGITAYRLSRETGVSSTRISEIVRGKRKITVETALRFAKYFGNSPEFWLGIQNEYDLRTGKMEWENELKAIPDIHDLVHAK